MLLLIFDCDGVLVDSELLEHGVDADLLADHGLATTAAAPKRRHGEGVGEMLPIEHTSARMPRTRWGTLLSLEELS